MQQSIARLPTYDSFYKGRFRMFSIMEEGIWGSLSLRELNPKFTSNIV